MQWAKNKQGFTIVELLIVVVVIAILATITIVSFSGIQSQAREAQLSAEINYVKKAMEMHKADVGSYPICPGGTTECMYVAGIRSQLTPKYVSTLPEYDFNYVRQSDDSRWGMRYRANEAPYAVSASCKFGYNMIASWYSSIPECS